jgi:hypothetical protein
MLKIVKGKKMSKKFFLVGLVMFMVSGYFFGQLLERPAEFRQEILFQVALKSDFVSEEEERGVSHRDVVDSYKESVKFFASALNNKLGAGNFSAKVSASEGLPDLVRLVGLPSGPEVTETELGDAVEVIAGEYQFKPIEILETRIEQQELESGAPGWQLGVLGSIAAGLVFSMSVILAHSLRTLMSRNS